MSTHTSPDHILKIGTGFFASKVLLSAVELGLFTALGDDAKTGTEIERELELHPRGTYDFLDALVALQLLERDGDGGEALYANTRDTRRFLDRASPDYVGGILEMSNARLYRFWADLTPALKTASRRMRSSIAASRCSTSSTRTPHGWNSSWAR